MEFVWEEKEKLVGVSAHAAESFHQTPFSSEISISFHYISTRTLANNIKIDMLTDSSPFYLYPNFEVIEDLC